MSCACLVADPLFGTQLELRKLQGNLPEVRQTLLCDFSKCSIHVPGAFSDVRLHCW